MTHLKSNFLLNYIILEFKMLLNLTKFLTFSEKTQKMKMLLNLTKIFNILRKNSKIEKCC